MIDWKKVAQQRLRCIKDYERWKDRLAWDLSRRVCRHLLIALHARCVRDADGIAKEVAASIAREIAEGPE